MTHDPVVSDLARYLTELDRRDTYQDKIYQLACELQRDRANAEEIMAEVYEDEKLKGEYLDATVVLINCVTEASEKIAKADICAVYHEAAMRLAKRQYDSEMEAAAEDLAVQRWERVCNRIREVA